MPADLDAPLQNPYASPQVCETPHRAQLQQEKPQPGSLALILGGFFMLLIGYLTSNLFVIGDLYHLAFGPDNQHIASPFAALFSSPAQEWGLYCLCAGATIAGCVMFGSQRYNPLAIVCYMMCPIASLIFLVAAPLRLARKTALPVAAIYLAVGGCLAGTGITQLVSLYGRPNLNFEPPLASMMAEVGLAFVVGAILKLSRCDDASEAVVVAAPASTGLTGAAVQL